MGISRAVRKNRGRDAFLPRAPRTKPDGRLTLKMTPSSAAFAVDVAPRRWIGDFFSNDVWSQSVQLDFGAVVAGGGASLLA